MPKSSWWNAYGLELQRTCRQAEQATCSSLFCSASCSESNCLARDTWDDWARAAKRGCRQFEMPRAWVWKEQTSHPPKTFKHQMINTTSSPKSAERLTGLHLSQKPMSLLSQNISVSVLVWAFFPGRRSETSSSAQGSQGSKPHPQREFPWTLLGHVNAFIFVRFKHRPCKWCQWKSTPWRI